MSDRDKRVVLRLSRRDLDGFGAALAAATGTFVDLPMLLAASETREALVLTVVETGVDAAVASEAGRDGLTVGRVRIVPADAGAGFSGALEDWQRTVATRTADTSCMVLVGLGQAADAPVEVAAVHGAGGSAAAMERVIIERTPQVRLWREGHPPALPELPPERVARFTSSFGVEAWQRLRRACAVVIGAGGTGSVAIPILARAGVGRIVIVDTDEISASNLERTHASFPEHVAAPTKKAVLARDHVRQIDPDINVVAIDGRLPQRAVVEAIAEADVLLGCTDQHTSRLALSDVARRFLVPAIDCGGLIEGANGHVTGQIIQLVLFRPDDPCPRCRGMINDVRVAQELMSPQERARLLAQSAGGAVPPEAADIPQIDTVGYITTVSGTLAAGYAIGWLTGRFDPPFERMQMNLVADCLDVTNRPQRIDPACGCRHARGLGDAGQVFAPFVPPAHWPPARTV